MPSPKYKLQEIHKKNPSVHVPPRFTSCNLFVVNTINSAIIQTIHPREAYAIQAKLPSPATIDKENSSPQNNQQKRSSTKYFLLESLHFSNGASEYLVGHFAPGIKQITNG